jgi:hypothetical protein
VQYRAEMQVALSARHITLAANQRAPDSTYPTGT